ncbi:hypothetical protein [Emticicia sp. BO119]|uniref:hypothetical protein n=1 Tax=Emticicia sp. BO119 TaxID=2757768 RepID=UPI0015F0DCC1|nr:hypothetical protein [Emticicia sp. BO119]MBA4850493.1 hypothetical protein [Emticicia sp. BO119]
MQEFDDDNLFKVTADSCHFKAKEAEVYHFDIKMTLAPMGTNASVKGLVYVQRVRNGSGTNIRISNIEAYRYVDFNTSLNIKLLGETE